MQTRELAPEEMPDALDLAWKVFLRFEAPDYSREGVETFRRTIHDPAYVRQIRCLGTWDGPRLVGIIATRNGGAHITLFFVEEAYHRRGIGRGLMEAARAEFSGDTMTVNASPYAVEAYRRLGFVASQPEQLTDGIRYTPMRYCRESLAKPHTAKREEAAR